MPISPTSDTSDAVKDMTGQAKQIIDGAADRVQAAADVANREVGAVGGNFQKAIDKSLGDQPYATLAIAALMGVVLGAIWKA